MKFEGEVLEWGDEALEFLEDAENPFFVLFGEGAPDILKEMSIIHSGKGTTADPAPGDKMTIGDYDYEITAVGEEAKTTLKELGHCCIKLTPADTPELPGCIHVKGPALKLSDIKVGMKISIG